MKHSTMALYGVPPTHFDDMLHFEALDEMVKLSRQRMRELHDEASIITYGTEHYDKLYDIYETTNKAGKHNEDLLNERKKHGNKSSKEGGQPSSH